MNTNTHEIFDPQYISQLPEHPNTDAMRVLVAAAKQRGVIVYDSKSPSGYFSSDLVCYMADHMYANDELILNTLIIPNTISPLTVQHRLGNLQLQIYYVSPILFNLPELKDCLPHDKGYLCIGLAKEPGIFINSFNEGLYNLSIESEELTSHVIFGAF